MGVYIRADGLVMQSRSPLFADFADLMTDAFSAAQATGEEVRSVFRAQAEKMAAELDLVSREEFEAVRAIAMALREENESLKARIDALEAKPAPARAAAKPAAKKPAAKKSSN
jgi:BMFP domain-containing protein YqiC